MMMLDEFKQEQPIAYKMLVNSLKKNRCSHAYLFETKHYPKKNELALAFAKYLLCPSHHTSKEDGENCTVCQRIEDGNFTELKTIEPDGAWIKKEQIDELQKSFSTKSVESSRKVYIIHSAEKMNASAANSILKFLEEPEENIVAILLTDNVYQLLNTIVSRCQRIPLQDINSEENLSTLEKVAYMIKNTSEEIQEFIQDEKNEDKLHAIVHFALEYEKEHKNVLLNSKKLWFDVFSDRDKMSDGLELLVLFYKDVLNHKLHLKLDIFQEYIDQVETLTKLLTPEDICNRLDVILEYKNYLKVNANINLLFDKLVIELERRR